MKTPALLTLFVLICVSALANASETPAQKAKTASLKELKKEALEIAIALSNAQDCEFKITETRTGVTLSVRDSKKSAAYLDIDAENEISLEVEAFERDGSSAQTFRVKDKGALRLVHADDAFDSAELTDREGRVISCELDL